MAFDEREIGAINDLFLAGDDEAAVKRVAKILDARDADYDTAISALALLRNHGMEVHWLAWATTLKERDFGVPTQLLPHPFPYERPFEETPWKFERVGSFLHFGQSGSSLAINPIKSVTVDSEGIEIKRRIGGERIAWTEFTGGQLVCERTKKMADLVGLAGIRKSLLLERETGSTITLDVSTCVREFDHPVQLLAAVRSRVDVAE